MFERIENVMISGSCIEPGDAEWIFGDGKDVEPFSVIEAHDLPSLLVACGIYKTTSEARRAGRDGPISKGFTRMKASKIVRDFCIWNPTVWIRDCPDDDA